MTSSDPLLPAVSSRLAVRRDTYQLVAISLNVEQKVHPVIWTVANLPFDCLRIAPVPRPIGGALVLAVNSLLYLNQSVPTYGVALNTITESSSRFPLSEWTGGGGRGRGGGQRRCVCWADGGSEMVGNGCRMFHFL